MSTARLARCRLYGFIDTMYVEDLDPGEVARDLVAGGVDILQVRAKERTHAERVDIGTPGGLRRVPLPCARHHR